MSSGPRSVSSRPRPRPAEARSTSAMLSSATHAVDDAAHAATDAADNAAHAVADAAGEVSHATGLDVAVQAVVDTAGAVAHHATGLDMAAHAVADTAGAGLDIAAHAVTDMVAPVKVSSESSSRRTLLSISDDLALDRELRALTTMPRGAVRRRFGAPRGGRGTRVSRALLPDQRRHGRPSMRDAACACVCVCGRRTSVRALTRAFLPSPLDRSRLHAHVGGWLRWSRGGAAVGATARRRGCVGVAVLVSVSQARRELEQLKRDRPIRHIPHPHPHLLLGTAHCRSPEGQHLAPRSAMPRGGGGGVSGGGGGP